MTPEQVAGLYGFTIGLFLPGVIATSVAYFRCLCRLANRYEYNREEEDCGCDEGVVGMQCECQPLTEIKEASSNCCECDRHDQCDQPEVGAEVEEEICECEDTCNNCDETCKDCDCNCHDNDNDNNDDVNEEDNNEDDDDDGNFIQEVV